MGFSRVCGTSNVPRLRAVGLSLLFLPEFFNGHFRHLLMARWGNAHLVEGLVGPVLGVIVQVDAVVLHPVAVVRLVQHLDWHASELLHYGPVFHFIIQSF